LSIRTAWYATRPQWCWRSPAMTQSAWEAEVQKMRNAYKAPIPEEQIQTITSYLAGLQNAK
jgi:hypothetical protein